MLNWNIFTYISICFYIFSHISIFCYIFLYGTYTYIYIYIYNKKIYRICLWGCFSDVRGPQIPKIYPQMFRTTIVNTSGTCFWNVSKNVEECVWTMLPYRVQYNESEYDFQNYNLFYKNTKTQICSKSWKVNRLFTP